MKSKEIQPPTFSAKVRQCLSDVIYGLVCAALIVIFRIFFHIRVIGKEHCPKKPEPLLVVSNHVSEWDPPFLGSFLPWQVNWLAKIELFELMSGWMEILFYTLHCVPLDRKKSDLSAIKEVVCLLKKRRPTVVFAEGGVRTDETSLLGVSPQLKEGAASMAILAHCPILPVLLNGTVSAYQWRNWIFFKRPMLEMIIGPVFELKETDRTKATQQILERLLELKAKLIQQQIC